MRGVVTNWERLAANAVVVALGSYSPLLLKRYGIKLPGSFGVFIRKGTEKLGLRNQSIFSGPPRMNVHKNARLTPVGREQRVCCGLICKARLGRNNGDKGGS